MRRLSLIALLLLSLSSVAQVSMTVQLPPTGVLKKAQLWNMLLLSTSATPIIVKIELRMSDAATNQLMLTGMSRKITVNKGAKQIQAGAVTPVTYEYLSADADRTQNGLLTAGNYIACYSVLVLAVVYGILSPDAGGGHDAVRQIIVNPWSESVEDHTERPYQ